jgi:hypothetical protein
LRFRHQTISQYIEEQKPLVPWYIRLGSRLPGIVRRKFEEVARGPRGTLTWLAEGDESHIKAYFGSLQHWRKIKDWDSINADRPSGIAVDLDHGYDESRRRENFNLDDARRAARFRGGWCLAKNLLQGDWFSQLHWKCHRGHEFLASLNLILKGGHWCPICTSNPSSYPILAEHSRFFRQVWEPDLYTA